MRSQHPKFRDSLVILSCGSGDHTIHMDGKVDTINGLILDHDTSKELFERSGKIEDLKVNIVKNILK